MPRGDRTGPAGAGPMTGRGSGLCRGNEYPGYRTAGGGRFGIYGMPGSGCRPAGRRRGFRRWFLETGIPGWMRFRITDTASHKDSGELLKSQAEFLRKSLDTVNKRLSEIEPEEDASE